MKSIVRPKSEYLSTKHLPIGSRTELVDSVSSGQTLFLRILRKRVRTLLCSFLYVSMCGINGVAGVVVRDNRAIRLSDHRIMRLMMIGLFVIKSRW